MGPALIVPVKRFNAAKRRLAAALDPAARAELARQMAEAVLAAGDGMAKAVVCDDDDVRAWAEALGVEVVWAPGRGLNGAVAAGVDALTARGADHLVVAHSDLPLARDLLWLTRFGGVSLVPDRRRDGTNVISFPARVAFEFAYGPGSFLHHLTAARRLDVPTRVINDPGLSWDVDVPTDLDVPAHLHPPTDLARPGTAGG